jgi:hypothetical protein
MFQLPSLRRALAATAAAAFVATAFTSCDTAKNLGSAAAKPFKAAGQAAGNTAKKANPMRLFKRDRKKGDTAADVEAEIAEVTPDAGNPPTTIDTPSRNTITPGAQPTPGTTTGGRSTLSLPSRPDIAQPSLPDLPTSRPAPTQLPTAAPTVPTTPSLEGEPSPLDNIPSLTEPVTPTTSDDGFIQLTPKLPGEEDLLPPE